MWEKIWALKALKQSVSNLNVKSVSAEHKTLTVQPSRSASCSPLPLSPALTLLSIYLRAGPVSKVRLMCLVPTFVAVLCCFASYHYVLLQCHLSKCHSLFFSVFCFCCECIILAPVLRKLVCTTFVSCTKLQEKQTYMAPNFFPIIGKTNHFPHHVTPKTELMRWTRKRTRHSVRVGTIESSTRFAAAWRCYNVELVLSQKDCWLSTDSGFQRANKPNNRHV